jgi:hypothetical protein
LNLIQGLKEIKEIVSNNTTPANLRMYFSCLAETKKASLGVLSKEAEIHVYGIICQSFGTELLDPLDKPPNLLKSVSRVIDNLQLYYKVS